MARTYIDDVAAIVPNRARGYQKALIGGAGDQLKVFNDGGQAGTRTYLFMMPRQKVAVAMMTNLQNPFCEELLPKFGAILGQK